MSFLGILSPADSSVDSSDLKMNSPFTLSSNFYMEHITENSPYLEINEQPAEKFRFRYKSEMAGTHGSLTGRNSDKVRRNTFPTVTLKNFDDRAIIRCSIYETKEDVPHAHRLVVKAGAGEKDDPHGCEVSQERGYTAVFQGMGIIHTAKKHLVSELSKKLKRLYIEQLHQTGIFRLPSTKEEAEITKRAEVFSKRINLNTVRLKFEAFAEQLVNNNLVLIPICEPIWSENINNLKSALTGELKIVRLDLTTASCEGGQQIFILVEKVTKNNIKVRFFESDEDDNEIWADYGKFSHNDVHHQYAIVFRVPPYRDLNIEKTVDVCIELVRPSDGARSEARIFHYKPRDKVGRKRARFNESLSSNELPATLNSLSFSSSTSLTELLRDPNFLKDMDNMNSDEFVYAFESVADEYEQILGLGSNLVTDSVPSKPAPIQHYDAENSTITKNVVLKLGACIKNCPSPEEMETLVKNLFKNFLSKEGNNALHTSILCEQYQHLQYILVLLSKMKHLNILDAQNNNGETALHLAVKMNAPTVVELLMSLDAKPNIGDKCSNTPLHLVIWENRNLSEYNTLLKCSNIDIQKQNDEGHAPLHLAILKNNLHAVKILVDHNANINQPTPSDGNTPLHIAIEQQCVDIVYYLLQINASIEVENYAKITPIHLAKILVTENKKSEQIYEIISKYIKERGFDIKEEPVVANDDDDEEENISSDNEEIYIKAEPMIIDEVKLKDEMFEENLIEKLSAVLDNTDALQKLSTEIGFDSVQNSLKKINTSMLLTYANVVGISVFDFRELLQKYELHEAIQEIDNLYFLQNT